MINRASRLKFKESSVNGRRLSGLTLLELVVSISLFAVVTLVATKVFTRVMDIQNRTKDLQNIEGDLRYAMGVFTDEIKGAQWMSDETCSVGCAGRYYCVIEGSPQSFWIKDKNGNCVKYSFNGTGLVVTRSGTNYTITSDDVTVTVVNFLVSGMGDRALIQISAQGADDYNKAISYQTAITTTNRRAGP